MMIEFNKLNYKTIRRSIRDLKFRYFDSIKVGQNGFLLSKEETNTISKILDFLNLTFENQIK